MEYGIQLYSVRDITGTDMPGALAQLAKIGYKSVEFAGFFGIPADEIKAMLDRNGLAVSGTHTGFTELTAEAIEATIAYHKAIGNKNIIIPGADLTTSAKLDAFIAVCNAAQPILAQNGIKLSYHNHDHEFFPNEDGQIIYDELVTRTKMDLEIDTFWAFAAKRNPTGMMEQFKDRLPCIHIKDGYADRKGMPLGMGDAPVARVYAKAVEMGIPMVVESETLTPDGLTEARICFAYLRSLEK